jgi:hypothetical protein
MTKDDIELGCEKLVANFGTVNPKKITLIYERFRSIPVGVWNDAVSQLLDNYEGSKFPSIATIRQYIESVTKGQPAEDTPEVAEMKRIDSEIHKMPEDDRKALFAIARDRTEIELSKTVDLESTVSSKRKVTKVSKEFLLSLQEMHYCLYKIHCRQVYREMQRTQYGKTGSPF